MKRYEGYIDVDGFKRLRVIGEDVTEVLPDHTGNNAGWGGDGYANYTAYKMIEDAYEGEDVVDEDGDSLASNYHGLFQKRVLDKLNPNEGFTLDWYDIRKMVDGWRNEDNG